MMYNANAREIPVFFSIDDNYAPFLAVALRSAIDHASPSNRYRAIVLHQGLSADNVTRLSALATENFRIDFVPMETSMAAITDRMSNRLRCDYFTLTIYFRLFIPAMFPQYDKGIYIDSDVVVMDDLAELFAVDIGDNYLGACADESVSDVPPLALYMEEGIGIRRDQYINSGVLLMNLKLLREKQLDAHFLHLLSTYHFDCIAPDQDYLNAICKDRIHFLPTRWDLMPNERKPAARDMGIIHYNLFSKPWCYDNIQYGEYFWHYAKDSGYYDALVAYKANYSDEQKASDAQCMGLLAQRGEQIARSEGNFKKMYESGVRIRL